MIIWAWVLGATMLFEDVPLDAPLEQREVVILNTSEIDEMRFFSLQSTTEAEFLWRCIEIRPDEIPGDIHVYLIPSRQKFHDWAWRVYNPHAMICGIYPTDTVPMTVSIQYQGVVYAD